MMKAVSIDLGQADNYPQAVSIKSEDSDEKRYPCLFIDTDEDLEIPESGKMTVEFKRTSKNTSENEEGDCRYSITLQIQKITAVDGGEVSAPSKSYDSAGDALDAIAKALSKGK